MIYMLLHMPRTLERRILKLKNYGEHPMKKLHSRLDGLYQSLYLGDSFSDSLSHQRILIVDVLQEFGY